MQECLVVCEGTDVVMPKRDTDRTGECCGIDDVCCAIASGIRDGVRENQSSLRVRVQHFDGLARECRDDIARPLRISVHHILNSGNVTGYIPTVENMVNGNAQRPGDIVTALSGKTIEVLNTDAEGRLILADAITYATRNGATHIVDAATLTGAIGVALGHYNIGAFTNDQAFLHRFLAASRVAGEKTWQLPM